MTQPAANNPRRRRDKPTGHLTDCWIDAETLRRLKAHVAARGLIQARFIERAIVTQLGIEEAGAALAPDAADS